MSKRYVEVLAILAKAETDYLVDTVPTGAANAMLMKSVTLEPLLGTDIPRELLLPYMGNQGVILAGHYSKITGDIEIAGAGAAGDVPAYGVLLRMCGLAEVVDEDTDVQYHPISRDFESGDVYYVLDGVRHILLGSRGKVSISDLKPTALGHFHFEITGILGTITDQAMPTLDLDAFIRPVPIGEPNTTLSVHGVTPPIETLSIDWGQQVETRFLINYNGIEIVDHPASGSVVVEAGLMAEKNWFAIAIAHTLGVLALQHGTVAGNIVKVDGGQVQIGRPTQGNTQKIANYTLPLMFVPSAAGNDELIITVK